METQSVAEVTSSVKSCNGWSLKDKTRFGGAVVGRERPRLSPHDDAIADGQLLSTRHTILSCDPGFVPSQSVRWRCKYSEGHTTNGPVGIAVPDQQLCHHFSSHEACAEYELRSTVLTSIPDAYITAIAANAAGEIFFADANSKSVFRGTHRDLKDRGEESPQDLGRSGFSTSVIISGTTNVWGLTISLQGHLYIADALSNTVGRIGCAYPTDVHDTVCLEYESWVRPMIVGNRMPSAVAVSSLGDVFVADALNNYVWSYCLNDNNFHEIVPPDSGTLNWPRYIARSRDGSTTYLSDVDNHRIVSVIYNQSVGLPAVCGAAVLSVDTVVADVEPSSLQLTADDHLAYMDLSTRRLQYIDLARPSTPPVQGPTFAAATGTFSLAPFGHLYFVDSGQQLRRLGCRVTNNEDNVLGRAIAIPVPVPANHSHASPQALNSSRAESKYFGQLRVESVALSIRATIIGIAAFVIAMLFVVVHRWYGKDRRYHSLSRNMRARRPSRHHSDSVFEQHRLIGEENYDDDNDDDNDNDDDDSDSIDSMSERLQDNHDDLQTVFDTDVTNLLDCDLSSMFHVDE